MRSPEPTSATDAVGVSPTWSIAQVERETGLGKDTLRVWERRYGFPQPLRDAQDERAYPDEQLVRLRMIKRLMDVGYRPGKVVPLPLERLQALLEQSNADDSADPTKSGQGESDPMDALVTTWVEWLAQDQMAPIRQSLQQHILRHGLGTVVDRLVAPLCGRVGMAWMRGDITVYQEHLMTEILQSVLREAMASVDASSQGLQQRPRILLTTTPQELHGLGLLMAECHFALESCERFVLGTSTPVADIALAVRQLEIDILALSFSAYTARKDMLDSLHQLLEQLPPTVSVWVGGTAASAHERALPEGVMLMRRAGDVPVGVAAWRARQAAA